jgi:hypothetical protein
VENIILQFLKTSFSHLEKMFKRYSKNGGETSTFCLVAVLAREAERLPSLRLEYDLDRNCKKNRRDLSGLAFGIIWYHSMFPPANSLLDQVEIGAGGNTSYHYWTEEELLGPIGSPPEFPEPIETVRTRIAETVGQLTVPKKVLTWHPTIDRLLKEDEKRREKELSEPYTFSWDKPRFDSPFERRRLRILNSLFFAVAKMNGKVSLHGREARDIGISFFQQHLPLSLDRPKKPNRRAQLVNTGEGSSDVQLCLSILKGWGSEEVLSTWQDDDAQKLEARMTDICIQLILTAEIKYRDNALHQYQWRIKRKADLEEEQRKRKLEAERAEKERQKRIEQGRVDRLLRDAAAFQQAGEIRKYVEAIRLKLSNEGSIPSEKFEQWSQWVLAQADWIDPATGRKFLTALEETEGS